MDFSQALRETPAVRSALIGGLVGAVLVLVVGGGVLLATGTVDFGSDDGLPDVVGKPTPEAEAILRAEGVSISIRSCGTLPGCTRTIASQIPDAGTDLPNDGVVTLTEK